MVICHRDDIDARDSERVEGGGRRSKVVLLHHRSPSLSNCGLKVRHRNIGTRKNRSDGGEDGAGVGRKFSAQRTLEMHIASECEGDRLAVAASRVAPGGGGGGRSADGRE